MLNFHRVAISFFHQLEPASFRIISTSKVVRSLNMLAAFASNFFKTASGHLKCTSILVWFMLGLPQLLAVGTCGNGNPVQNQGSLQQTCMERKAGKDQSSNVVHLSFPRTIHQCPSPLLPHVPASSANSMWVMNAQSTLTPGLGNHT